MKDKLKCPFCGSELNDYPDKTTGVRMAVCRNPKCKYDGWHFPIDITQRMIDGKRAQDTLKEIVNFFDTECGKDALYFYNLIDDNIVKYREIISITKRENK